MLPSGFSLRPAIVSWRTTSDDVALLAREVARLGDELSSGARRAIRRNADPSPREDP
jgi:hypothetical protein